jgi:hypothetical protein
MLVGGMIPADRSLAQEGGGDIVIAVRVIPPFPPATITAVLSSGGTGPDGLVDTEAFDLTVDDHRGSPYGWQVDVQHANLAGSGGALWLIDQQCPTSDDAGLSPRVAVVPCTGWLSAGLPLDGPVPILVAAPGGERGDRTRASSSDRCDVTQPARRS